MLTKRIIPCLDMTEGKVVKGIKFKSFRDAGDPIDLAARYDKEGADELVFLDITATVENRDILLDVVKKTSKKISIPFSVGGGIRTVMDIRKILANGADKVSINTGGFLKPKLISDAANMFGSQCIVLSADVKNVSQNRWNVYIKDGRKNTGVSIIDWVKKAIALGAGEILLTSIDRDGTKKGFDVELTKAVTNVVNVPVIASGGAGRLEDFENVLSVGKADAALAASLFHFKELSIYQIKSYLQSKKVNIRPFAISGKNNSFSTKRTVLKKLKNKFRDDKLIPAIIQERASNQVLMLGYMNEVAYKKTLVEKTLYLWSRSRKKLWKKGETSGNTLKVKEIFIDCDQDALLVKVKNEGKVICHTGKTSCFFNPNLSYESQ